MIFVQAKRLLKELMCLDINILILLTSLCRTEETIPECKENVGGCCEGYFWNVLTEKCEVCMSGYFGRNCSLQCPYPTFGKRCQGNCDCEQDLCDVSTGCKNLTTDVQTTPYVKFSTDADSGNSTTSISATDYTLNNDSLRVSSINEILLNLITIFGGLDVILICAHSALFVRDRLMQHRALEVVHSGYISEDNTLYENAEIMFISSGVQDNLP